MDGEAQLKHLLSRISCTETVSSQVRSCIAELYRLLVTVDPSWQLRVFGSFGNGMCLNGSDLDVTCYNVNRSSQDVLSELHSLLGKHEQFSVVELISAARVPILKLKFDDALDVDISCNNTEPFKNTQLLRAYSELAPSLREFLLLVKTWAKAAGVTGAKDGNLSSYSLTLMAIYFMQVDPRINLPCLPVSDFDGGTDLPLSARFSWKLVMPRTILLYRFFSFYSYEFIWGEEVVAMHLGRRTTRYELVHSELSDTCYPRLHVADPFLLNRNLNCVLKAENEVWLYNQMKAAADALHVGALPVGLSGASSFSAGVPTIVNLTTQLPEAGLASLKTFSPALPSLHSNVLASAKQSAGQSIEMAQIGATRRSTNLATKGGEVFSTRQLKNGAFGNKDCKVQKGHFQAQVLTRPLAPEVSDIPMPRLRISV